MVGADPSISHVTVALGKPETTHLNDTVSDVFFVTVLEGVSSEIARGTEITICEKSTKLF